VDPVPDLLLRNSGRVGNRTRTSGSVAKNSDPLILSILRMGSLNCCLDIMSSTMPINLNFLKGWKEGGGGVSMPEFCL
jgi:hypothetical protein